MYTITKTKVLTVVGAGALALALLASPPVGVSPDGTLALSGEAYAQGAGQGPTGGGANYGTSTGPGAVNRQQNNYGGGGGGGGGTVPGGVTTSTTALEGTVGSGSYTPRTSAALPQGWCVDESFKGASAPDRLTGKNLMRLDAVRATIAPQYSPTWQSPFYLLSNYQAELEKENPNTTMSGTALGMVSAVPVTPEVVNEVNSLLCVTAEPEDVAVIATTAEVQRQSLKQ